MKGWSTVSWSAMVATSRRSSTCDRGDHRDLITYSNHDRDDHGFSPLAHDGWLKRIWLEFGYVLQLLLGRASVNE